MSWFRHIRELIFDPSRNFKDRVFVLLTLVAIPIIGIATFGDILYGENIVEIVTLIATLILTPAATYLGVKTNRTAVAAGLVCAGTILVVLPVVYIFGGGTGGACALWMVFSYLFIGLALSGLWRAVALLMLTLMITGLFTLGYYHPELIHEHTRQISYLDIFLAVIEVGFVCCIMTWFQNRLFMEENKRSREETRKVEELNRSQSRFFSSMSHEIRTPINSILGLNEIILRQEDASEEILRDAGNIQGAGRMLLTLINDILDFSRIEAGKMDIVPVNYSVSALVSEIVNMIWLRAEQKGLEFKLEVDPSIPSELFGDEVRIKQILVNLLNNAVKYTSKGTVTLHIEKENTREDQILLAFSVIDTGMGIKQDAMPYLFDAFRRVDEEKTGRIEGTGLGLSIVKQLVDLMDGRITVNSVYTQGSTFMVTLWQKVSRADAVGDISITSINGTGSGGRYQASFTAPDARLLIVDDNEMNLEVEKKLLADTEIGVDTVMSGEEALSLTSSVRFDMILMDHMMPGMDGIECMQHIRKQKDGLNNHVPIIVLTANADSESRELYSSSGFDGYLMKPVTGQRLEEAILSCLPDAKVQRTESGDAARLQLSTAGSYSRRIPVVVATNSTCDLPSAVIRELQIDIIPFSIHAEGKTYYDTVEVGTDELIRYMKAGVEFTSDPPTEQEFESFFGQELKKAHNVIYIATSSAISSEYERAMAAARAYGNVTVFDSRSASAGIGLLVLLAYRMSAQGRTPDRIAEELQKVRERLQCSFIVDGSYFVQRKGFFDRSIYNIIRILNIHPFIRLDEGRYHIGRISAGEGVSSYERYIDYALPRFSRPDTDLLMVIYVDLSTGELELIEKRIRRRVPFKTIIFRKASGVLAMNSGSGSFGLIFMNGRGKDLNLGSMLTAAVGHGEPEEPAPAVDGTAKEPVQNVGDPASGKAEPAIGHGKPEEPAPAVDVTAKEPVQNVGDPASVKAAPALGHGKPEEPAPSADREKQTESAADTVSADGGRTARSIPAQARQDVAQTTGRMPAAPPDAGKWYEGLPGIDPALGIRYSGSEEVFRTVLKVFYDGIDKKSGEIEDYFNGRDWENYVIKVHALKSSARIIGAVSLSESARALEEAGKSGDTEYIEANHARVLETFRGYHTHLRHLFSDEGDASADKKGSSYERIPGARGTVDQSLVESAYEAIREGAVARKGADIGRIFKEIAEYRLSPVDIDRMEQLKRCFERGDYDGMTAIIDGRNA